MEYALNLFTKRVDNLNELFLSDETGGGNFFFELFRGVAVVVVSLNEPYMSELE